VSDVDPRVDRLRRALDVVDSAQLPDALRPTGLVLAYWDSVTSSPPEGASPSTAQNPAEILGCDALAVARVYDVDDDGVHLNIRRSALASSRRAAMEQIALLVVAGRQAHKIEEWTQADVVRKACEEMGVLDGHFAAALDRLKGDGLRLRGTGATREMKMNAAGFEQAGRLITSLAASSG
jgi:hypothetical protein